MKSGVVTRLASDTGSDGSLRQHGSLLERIELLRSLAELLVTFSRRTSTRELLWSLRALCERAESQTWVPPDEGADILRAYAEGVGGRASTWLREMALYERAVANAAMDVEAYGWACVHSEADDDAQKVRAAIREVRAAGERLRRASAELSASIEREATRMVAKCRFCGGGVIRRLAGVRTLARAARVAPAGGASW